MSAPRGRRATMLSRSLNLMSRGREHVHTLWLLQGSPYVSGHFTCHVCWEKGSGPLYHCPDCQFDVHVTCTGGGSGGGLNGGHVALSHFSHFDHPLLLRSSLSSTSDEVVCDCCGESHQGSNATIYRCNQCDFDLCGLCIRAPRFLLHISHPHILVLSTLEEMRRSCQCDACGEAARGMMYRCTSCNYDLHVSCARLALRPMLQALHPDHPLTLLCREEDTWKASSLYACDACGREIRGWAYECSLCGFHVHAATCGWVAHELPARSSASLSHFKHMDSKVAQRALMNSSSPHYYNTSRSLSLPSHSSALLNRTYSSSSTLSEPFSPHPSYYGSHTYSNPSSLDNREYHRSYSSPRTITHGDLWNENRVSTNAIANTLSSRLTPLNSRDVDALDRVMTMLRHNGSPPYA